MRFPIHNLLDQDTCKAWIEEHFHSNGLKCPHCQASLENAREFRQTDESQLTVYRCERCDEAYNLYSGTVFEGCHFSPGEIVMLLRGILQGKTTRKVADELDVTYKTALKWRHRVQEQALEQVMETLPDDIVEVDEMFKTAGKKRDTAPG